MQSLAKKKKKGQILVSLEVAWLHQKTFRKDRKNVNKNIFISFAFSLLSKESCEFEDHSVIFPFPCVLLKTVRICERPVRSFETKSKKNFFIYHFWDSLFNTGIRFFKFRKLFSMSLPADPAAMAVSSYDYCKNVEIDEHSIDSIFRPKQIIIPAESLLRQKKKWF